MQYEAIGNINPVIQIFLQKEEALWAKPGTLKWKTRSITSAPSEHAGVSPDPENPTHLILYSAAQAGMITLGKHRTGDAVTLQVVDGQQYSLHEAVFLGASQLIQMEKINREEPCFWNIHGEGLLMLSAPGDIIELTLGEDDEIQVETNCICLYESSVTATKAPAGDKLNLTNTGGFKQASILRGPGQLWLQTSS